MQSNRIEVSIKSSSFFGSDEERRLMYKIIDVVCDRTGAKKLGSGGGCGEIDFGLEFERGKATEVRAALDAAIAEIAPDFTYRTATTRTRRKSTKAEDALHANDPYATRT